MGFSTVLYTLEFTFQLRVAVYQRFLNGNGDHWRLRTRPMLWLLTPSVLYPLVLVSVRLSGPPSSSLFPAESACTTHQDGSSPCFVRIGTESPTFVGSTPPPSAASTEEGLHSVDTEFRLGQQQSSCSSWTC